MRASMTDGRAVSKSMPIGWLSGCGPPCRVLKTGGSIFLHCDWHASHFLRVKLDQIFGADKFINEIIWCYETGGRSKSFYPRKHDTIFWYSKTTKHQFFYDQIALERDFSTMHETVHEDADGRPYQTNFKNGKLYKYYLDKGVLPNDWWADIQALNPAAKGHLSLSDSEAGETSRAHSAHREHKGRFDPRSILRMRHNDRCRGTLRTQLDRYRHIANGG